jgi:hypothetical protein
MPLLILGKYSISNKIAIISKENCVKRKNLTYPPEETRETCFKSREKEIFLGEI